MKPQPLIDWIVCKLEAYSSQIGKVAIYGSIARHSEKPNDCDLLIVSLVDVESEAWLSLRQRISSVRLDFVDEFGLHLNVALLTEGEWAENASFFTDLLEVRFRAG